MYAGSWVLAQLLISYECIDSRVAGKGIPIMSLSFSFQFQPFKPTVIISNMLRDGSRYQIGWIFGKIPNGLQPPTLHFRKIMLQILYSGYGRVYARRYEGQIVWNACTCLLQSVSCFDFSQYIFLRKKTYPEPWIYSFYIDVMLKKPCLKFPKSVT